MKLARAATIASILLEEGLGDLTPKEPDPEEDPPPESESAVRLRKTLERLGPTFVKFGQMLATRVDLFSEPFTDELGELYASVAPFPTEQARVLVEEELGRPIDGVFVPAAEAGEAADEAGALLQRVHDPRRVPAGRECVAAAHRGASPGRLRGGGAARHHRGAAHRPGAVVTLGGGPSRRRWRPRRPGPRGRRRRCRGRVRSR